jgi:hypothetical protein
VWPTPGDHVYADVRGVFSLDHSFTPCPAPAPRHLPLPSLLPSRFPRFASCSSTDAPQVLDVFKLIDVTDDTAPSGIHATTSLDSRIGRPIPVDTKCNTRGTRAGSTSGVCGEIEGRRTAGGIGLLMFVR